jgi:hypothetical protein
MTTHGRTGLKRLLFGSVAEAVVRRADVPVFMLRAAHLEAAARVVEISTGNSYTPRRTYTRALPYDCIGEIPREIRYASHQRAISRSSARRSEYRRSTSRMNRSASVAAGTSSRGATAKS